MPRITPSRPRILVVDDEALILSFVARALQNEGYRVVEARNAEEALERLRTDASFSMLLSDVGLPGMSGAELVRRVRAFDPTLPTLLMSADSQASLVDRGVLTPGTELFAKPFSVTNLLAKVEQTLEPTSHTLQHSI